MAGYEALREWLFKLQPETAHNMAETAMRLAEKTPYALKFMAENYALVSDRLTQNVWGLEFLNPLGLAAGFDKNGTMIRPMTALGFGFIETGTVTPKPQPGNPKPRLWRHVGHKSLQNAMGFNNDGVDALVDRLEKLTPYVLPIGVNVGKNKATPADKALEDYRICVEKSESVADYLVFNLSSPNTPGLRDLQSESFVRNLFAMAKTLTQKPVLLKIAPDLEAGNALSLCQSAIEAGAAGIIATNTTNQYDLIAGSEANGGGLSGEILREKSRLLFDALSSELFGQTVLISCGGIMDADEAWKRIKMGATLVQGYTGFIYGGPAYASTLLRGVIARMKDEGFSHITDAIGADRR